MLPRKDQLTKFCTISLQIKLVYCGDRGTRVCKQLWQAEEIWTLAFGPVCWLWADLFYKEARGKMLPQKLGGFFGECEGRENCVNCGRVLQQSRKSLG